MNASVTMPLHCTCCGRPVTVEYIPEALAESQTHPPMWPCPYDGCIGTNLMGGVRTIVSVSTGHAAKFGDG